MFLKCDFCSWFQCKWNSSTEDIWMLKGPTNQKHLVNLRADEMDPTVTWMLLGHPRPYSMKMAWIPEDWRLLFLHWVPCMYQASGSKYSKIHTRSNMQLYICTETARHSRSFPTLLPLLIHVVEHIAELQFIAKKEVTRPDIFWSCGGLKFGIISNYPGFAAGLYWTFDVIFFAPTFCFCNLPIKIQEKQCV